MGKFKNDLKIYYDKLRDNIELVQKIIEVHPNKIEEVSTLLSNEERLKEYLDMTAYFHELCTKNLETEPKVSKSFVRTLKIIKK